MTLAVEPPLGPPIAAGDDELGRALVRMQIVSADQLIRLTALTGGVSSDIYRVDVPSGVVCVKRALARLKVAADWQVPVARNRWEVEWMRSVAAIVPTAVPQILGEDAVAGAFAMAFLPPDRFPVWKHLLAEGAGTVAMAAQVGDILGRIHAATADRPEVQARFATDELFYAIRLEPYLVTAARAHARLADRMLALAATTAGTKRTLVHGDFSPKNILIGAEGPVILDAECAWYGDPAFDLAFVLNHLLLKGVWRPQWRAAYAAMSAALRDAYRLHVAWEPWPVLEARTAALLPGLLLARVDGKSPVEYLTDDRTRDAIRAFARQYLLKPATSLEQVVHSFAP
jgi:aminoglycoside phosphotransferase (APT) family kinase protein